jgi:hypothetical protein
VGDCVLLMIMCLFVGRLWAPNKIARGCVCVMGAMNEPSNLAYNCGGTCVYISPSQLVKSCWVMPLGALIGPQWQPIRCLKSPPKISYFGYDRSWLWRVPCKLLKDFSFLSCSDFHLLWRFTNLASTGWRPRNLFFFSLLCDIMLEHLTTIRGGRPPVFCSWLLPRLFKLIACL